jgi:hypothetical protein
MLLLAGFNKWRYLLEDLGTAVSTVQSKFTRRIRNEDYLTLSDPKSSYNIYFKICCIWRSTTYLKMGRDTKWQLMQSTQAHTAHLAYIINKALDIKK